MIRFLYSCICAVLAAIFLAVQVTAGPHLLPRVRLPRINLGKAVEAVTYPVTKSVVNGGKTVLKTAATAKSLGVVPSIGPPSVNNVAKKVIIGMGRH